MMRTVISANPTLALPIHSAICNLQSAICNRSRRGVVLLIVLIVVVLLTLAAYQFGELMTAEYAAADSYNRSAQARRLADSGIQYSAAALGNTNTFNTALGGNPYDNASFFQAIAVQGNGPGNSQGRFSVIAPLDPDDPAGGSQPYRYGVTDESGKLNLNALMTLDSSGKVAHDMLMNLPNMTEDIANSILDWIDPDSDTRTNGAEDDYYTSLSPPYHVKNGPLDSLEELLLVKGVTPDLLFGNDTDRSGTQQYRGWSAYLTVYSRELNVDSQGNPRIYVNDPDLQGLYQKLTTALSADLANYIIAYRMYGPAQQQQSTPGGTAPAAGSGTGAVAGRLSSASAASAASAQAPAASAASGARGAASTGGGTSAAGTGTSGATPRLTRATLGNFGQRPPQRISSLYELINSRVSIPGSAPGTQATTYPSPLNDPSTLSQLLPLLLDEVTTVQGIEIPARINVNTAPRTVLSALPGLSPADVENIIDHRPSFSSAEPPDPIYQTPAWLITQANFSPQTLRTLDRYITARSQVYRVQSVGYFDGGGPAARVEAVIDTNAGRPRIIYWRDLTELGKGYNLQNR